MTSLPTLSPQFRVRALRSVLAIVLFVLVYFAMLAGSLYLLYLSGWAAFALVTTLRHWIVIVLGLGLVLSCGLLVYFLIKFLFQKTETGVQTDVQVSAEDEPELFALIEEVVSQLDVKRPKKVFLTQEVNASVIYDSTFWSMFFPVRKNLRIGLGLLNTLTRDELRAVVAHEFGHFSQRSMAIGSYVYQVNHILFNLVNDDGTFDSAAQGIASISAYIYPIIWIVMQIVRGARWVLAKLYDVINLSYLGLSREMEYHADAVAASIGGGPGLASGLRRMELADRSYNQAVQHILGRARAGEKVLNIYPLQTACMQELAKKDDLPYQGALPVVNGQEAKRYLKSLISLDEQWASHPETEDRIAHLQLSGTEMGTVEVKATAMDLLRDPTSRQRELTGILLNNNQEYAAAELSAREAEALQKLREEQTTNRLPEMFNGYFDHHNLAPLSRSIAPRPSAGPDNGPPAHSPQKDLFTDECVADLDRYLVVKHDLSLLEQIAAPDSTVKTFDYAGEKYRKAKAATLIQQLQREREELQARIEGYDRAILAAALADAERVGAFESFTATLDRYFEMETTSDQYAERIMAIRNGSYFIQYNLPIEEINEHLVQYGTAIDGFRETALGMLTDATYSTSATPAEKDKLEQYLREKRKLFVHDAYVPEAIQLLFEAVEAAEMTLQETYRKQRREFYAALAQRLPY